MAGSIPNLTPMTIGEIGQLYEAARTPQEQFLLTALETIRLKSLANLRWQDIIPGEGWHDGKIVVHDNSGSRTLNVPAKLMKIGKVYYDQCVLDNPDVDIGNHYVMNRNCLHVFNGLVRKTHLTDASPHRFRLSAASCP